MKKEILIVGLGLIGGSYAKRLTSIGYDVYAISRSHETIEYAVKNGIIISGDTNVKKEFVSRFDLIVFGLYPHVLLEWLKEYKDYLKDGSILTDVTGVKGEIVYKVEDILKDRKAYFVGSHPMAGREVYGIKNAKEDLFIGSNFIITPTANSNPLAIQRIKALGEDLGFKNIAILSPKEHDEMIAYLSQLTHLIAVSLMTAQDKTHLEKYTGDSFRDLTRIANINEDMWSELFFLNKEELLKQTDLFIGELTKIKDLIQNDKIEELKEKMRLSTERRKHFNKGE